MSSTDSRGSRRVAGGGRGRLRFVKPFSPGELLDRIRALADKRVPIPSR